MNIIFDEFCFNKKCEQYVDWQYTNDEHSRPIDCTSCKLVGQSHNITEVPKDCVFLKEIKEYANDIVNQIGLS